MCLPPLLPFPGVCVRVVFTVIRRGHMVKNHSAREESLCRHYMGYSFRLAATDISYPPFHRHAFVTPFVKHWLEREIAQ